MSQNRRNLNLTAGGAEFLVWYIAPALFRMATNKIDCVIPESVRIRISFVNGVFWINLKFALNDPRYSIHFIFVVGNYSETY